MTDAAEFRPSASWDAIKARAALLAKTREFFASRGFLEVETPLVSSDTVVDRHLDPLITKLSGFDNPRFLQTSPEFAMKRLLADAADQEDGPEAIYQITRAFRDAELGRLHNPEFTIVEWYRMGDTMAEGMQLLSDLTEELLGRGPAEQITYAGAFQRHLEYRPADGHRA